jgi:hypothetical protein
LEVLVSVDVADRMSDRGDAFELGTELPGDLAGIDPAKGELCGKCMPCPGKSPAPIDEGRDLRRG